MRAALFVTCLGDHFFADAGVAAVRLLRHLGVEVTFPPAQSCCGQPAFNAGHAEEARAMARHTLRVFEGAEAVVLPSGSCTAMLRRFYGGLFDAGSEEATLARDLGGRARELCELVSEVLGTEDLGDGLRGRRVAYHHGCHALRELGIREAPLRLLRGAGAEVVPWEADEECCGFGGLFSVKNPEVSAAMADRKLDALPDVDVLTSADGGCLLQLRGRLERRGLDLPVRHLAELLWEGVTGTGSATVRPGRGSEGGGDGGP